MFMGSALPYGFINVFKSEVRKKFEGLSVHNGGSRHYQSERLLSGLDLMVETYKPTKIVLILDHDHFTGVTIESLREVKREIEHLVVKVLAFGIEPILCSSIVIGEKDSGDNALLDEYLGVTRRIASDYRIAHIDLFSEMCKYLEMVNIDNQPHSILTHDGTILNERGHYLVASIILHSFGVYSYRSNMNSAVVLEQERVKQIKADVQHMRKHGLFSSEDSDGNSESSDTLRSEL